MTTDDPIARADALHAETLRRIAERDRRRWNLAYMAIHGDEQHRERARRELRELCEATTVSVIA
jgi:hypothetical protein